MASISVTPWARAASSTCWKTSSGIGGPDLDLAKTRRARAVAGAHHLLGLPLAAVGNTPQGPMPAVRDGDALVPELGGDAAVAGILQHAHAAAVVDLPSDLAAELEVVALVIDRPAPVGFHVDAIGVEDVVEREVAGLETHVGHADERNSRPAIGAHAAVGAGFAHRSRGLARRHVAGELAAADDIGALRGNAFVVEGEGAEAGTVIEARVAHHVDDRRAVAPVAQLIEREEAHAGVVRLAAEDAIELDGVADGLVNLEAELRAAEDEIEFAFGALRRVVERDSFFGDAVGVLHQLQLVDQLVAFQLVLAAERVRKRAFLDLAVFVAERGEARAGEAARLIDDAADGGDEYLARAIEVHRRFGEADSCDPAQLPLDLKQRGELAIDGDRERVDLHR